MLISIILLFVLGHFPGVPGPSGYEWKLVKPPGSGCFPPRCSSGKFPMAIMPVAAPDGSLASIGDTALWTSRDGLEWVSRPKTDWGERHGMRFVHFRGRYFMTGGMRAWDDFRNDVWASDDGVSWTQVVKSAPWEPRRNHQLLEFDGSLILIGGDIGSGRRDVTPERSHSDVWSSPDGVVWTRILEKTPWPANSNVSAVVHQKAIWLLDGDSGDVWASRDAANWSIQHSASPWKGRRGHSVHVLDGKIWVLGGVERNDVWSSTDGKKWELEFEAAPWSKRSTYYSAVHNGRLLLFSGKTGRDDSWEGDIWAMRRKTE